MLPLDAYITERRRPSGRPAFRQRWRDLLFLHFPIEPDLIRPHVPNGLELDTFARPDGQEQAWLGLVPFRMEGIRLRGLPGLPGHSAMPETNVRTYVHRAGRPGVWFFSLDAASSLACRVARRFFHLPYHEAAMSVLRRGDSLSYESRRRSGSVGSSLLARVLGAPCFAEPGSLEFFLIERYLLFSTNGGNWFTGSVHHSPYPLRTAELEGCEQSLLGALGLPCQAFSHVLFSEGVDVTVDWLGRA